MIKKIMLTTILTIYILFCFSYTTNASIPTNAYILWNVNNPLPNSYKYVNVSDQYAFPYGANYFSGNYINTSLFEDDIICNVWGEPNYELSSSNIYQLKDDFKGYSEVFRAEENFEHHGRSHFTKLHDATAFIITNIEIFGLCEKNDWKGLSNNVLTVSICGVDSLTGLPNTSLIYSQSSKYAYDLNSYDGDLNKNFITLNFEMDNSSILQIPNDYCILIHFTTENGNSFDLYESSYDWYHNGVGYQTNDGNTWYPDDNDGDLIFRLYGTFNTFIQRTNNNVDNTTINIGGIVSFDNFTILLSYLFILMYFIFNNKTNKLFIASKSHYIFILSTLVLLLGIEIDAFISYGVLDSFQRAILLPFILVFIMLLWLTKNNK